MGAELAALPLRAAGKKLAPWSPRLRVLDLFSGVGGLAIGFAKSAAEHGLAVESRGAVDLDEAALAVYAANLATAYPYSRSVASIVDFQVRGEGESAKFFYEPELVGSAADDFPGEVDVVLAGPPCQGIRPSTTRREETTRATASISPSLLAVAVGAQTVVIENVPGVVRSRGNVVETAIVLLQNAGYHVTTAKLAADRLGWPQTRQRFFLVATRGGSPTPLDEIALNMRRSPLPVSWAIDDLLECRSD